MKMAFLWTRAEPCSNPRFGEATREMPMSMFPRRHGPAMPPLMKRHVKQLLILLFGLSLVACGPAREEPTVQDALAYFGIRDGAEFVYRGVGGLEEVHTFERNLGFGDREAYDRIVRRGGFAEDDSIFTVEATLEGLSLVRFSACLTSCGEPQEPIDFLPWPLQGGESLQTDVVVSYRTGEEEPVDRAESHRIQVERSTELLSLPAGEFDAFPVLWSRTIDSTTSAAKFWFAPEVGIVVSEGFDGARFELQELR